MFTSNSLPGISHLWKTSKGNRTIKIAILDGPVDPTHPCFSGADLEYPANANVTDSAASRHGTHVTSIIFGQHGSNVDGIAPGCKGLILPIYSTDSDDSIKPCTQEELAKTITTAVNEGAHIINISGGKLDYSGTPHPSLERAIGFCEDKNVLIVAAAGNDGCQCLHIPAAVKSVLAVGAMGSDGKPKEFSNWGEAYGTNGILTYGENIRGAVPGGTVAPMSGTSFAAPIVSGVAALLLSVQVTRGENPDPSKIKDILLQSARPCDIHADSDCRKVLAGRLDVVRAATLLNEQPVTAGSAQEAITLSAEGGHWSHCNANKAEFPDQPSPKANSKHQTYKTLNHITKIQPKKNKEKTMLEETNVTQTHHEDVQKESSEITLSHEETEVLESSELQIQEENSTEVAPVIRAAEISQRDPNLQIAVEPSHCGCGGGDGKPCACGGKQPSLIYALGNIGHEFASEEIRDSIQQYMGPAVPPSSTEPHPPAGNPDDPFQIVRYLLGDDKHRNIYPPHPEDAVNIIWTLMSSATPIYTIRPTDPYGDIAYRRLIDFLNEQLDPDQQFPKGDKSGTAKSKKFQVELVSVPGVVTGSQTLMSGLTVPVIEPVTRGLAGWSIAAQVQHLGDVHNIKDDDLSSRLKNFLQRIFFQYRNLGAEPNERALNYAGTNAFSFATIVFNTKMKDYMLDSIAAVKSQVCRPGSDCWDITLTFFNTSNRLTKPRKQFMYTVDVSGALPVNIGETREWDTN